MVSTRKYQVQIVGLLASTLALLFALSNTNPCSAQSPHDPVQSFGSYYDSGADFDEPLDAFPAVAELQPREEERQPERAPAPAPRPRRPTDRLSSVPQMFGDFFANSGQLLVDADPNSPQDFFLTDVPMAGGSRRVKIGENNKPYTDDRVYFMYNHFHNALQVREDPDVDFATGDITGFSGAARKFPVDRYTFGIEKSFFDGSFSAEVRMPFTSTFDFASSTPSSDFNVSGGNVGNLAVILKALLFASDNGAVAAGLGFDLPTGSDVSGRFGDTNFSIENQAYHFLPFIGFLSSPNDVIFFNGFAQLDVAANGNAIDTQNLFVPMLSGRLGKYTEQNLLYLDASGGVWLYRDAEATRFTGLAGIVELHYTSTIQDTDVVPARQLNGLSDLEIRNVSNRSDILNVTAGLHAELGECSNVRVAVVVPVRRNNDLVFGPTDRFFDSELQVQFNRRY